MTEPIWKTTKYTKQVRITEADWKWLNQNKSQKSQAGFLEQVIKEAKKSKLF